MRQEAGYTQVELADAIGISLSRITNLEIYRNPLRWPLGLGICRLTDTAPAWLATGTGARRGFVDPGISGVDLAKYDRRLFSEAFAELARIRRKNVDGRDRIQIEVAVKYHSQRREGDFPAVLTLVRPSAKEKLRLARMPAGYDQSWNMLLSCIADHDEGILEDLLPESLNELLLAAESLCSN
ncbi:MAG: helix-turn-helix domain-containing protein [Limisphaerales bacterium]